VQVEENQIARALEEMDANELRVVVAKAQVPVAFNWDADHTSPHSKLTIELNGT